MSEGAIQMMRRCRTCQGRGVIEDYHCHLCQQRIAGDDDWWDSDDEVLPCGHEGENLVEIVRFSACGGAGRSEKWLTPAEVKAIQPGKIARIAFVGGLSLLLLVNLATVISTSSRSQPFCGSWGYAAPLLLFLANYLWPA
jgi:hypothetical protein